jgi:hypothetical protein
LITPSADRHSLTITDGIPERVRRSYQTPMFDRFHWKRSIAFEDEAINVSVELDAQEPLARVLEIIPLAIFQDTKLAATTSNGERIDAPWDGVRHINSFEIRRGKAGVTIVLRSPADASWAAETSALDGCAGAPGRVRALRLAIESKQASQRAEFRYALRFVRDGGLPPLPALAVATLGQPLPAASRGKHYEVALESPDARPLYWSVSGGGLPRGIALARNGLLSGTCHDSGTFTFDLTGHTPYAEAPFNESEVTIKRVTLKVE